MDLILEQSHTELLPGGSLPDRVLGTCALDGGWITDWREIGYRDGRLVHATEASYYHPFTPRKRRYRGTAPR